MQNRANKKLADISFTLIHEHQSAKPNAAVSQELERLAPAFVDQFCSSLGVETAQFKVTLPRDKNGTLFGYIVNVTVLLDETKQNKTKEEWWPDVTSAIEACAKALDPNSTCLVFADKNQNDFDVKHREESTEKMLFKGKVQKRTYEYYVSNATNSMGVEFVNEAECNVKHHSHQRQMTYDRWSNITSITYLYQPCVVDKLGLAKLEKEAEALVKANEQYRTYLQAIKDRNFGQALRKACAVGDDNLYDLLIKFASNGVIDLNVNEFTAAKKTALDYAHQSQNEGLVHALKMNGAKIYNDLKYRLAEKDRAEINKHNPRRDQRGMGAPSPFAAEAFQPHRPPRRPQELINTALVEECLRTGRHFKEYVHTPMTNEEKQNLKAYERQCRIEHNHKNGIFPSTGSFGFQHSLHRRQEPRRPQDLINSVYIDQCLRSNTPFEMFATQQMTSEEKEILKAYERKCREEYKRKQESDQRDRRPTFGFQHHNQPRNPWDRDHKNDDDPFASFKSNQRW